MRPLAERGNNTLPPSGEKSFIPLPHPIKYIICPIVYPHIKLMATRANSLLHDLTKVYMLLSYRTVVLVLIYLMIKINVGIKVFSPAIT